MVAQSQKGQQCCRVTPTHPRPPSWPPICWLQPPDGATSCGHSNIAHLPASFWGRASERGACRQMKSWSGSHVCRSGEPPERGILIKTSESMFGGEKNQSTDQYYVAYVAMVVSGEDRICFWSFLFFTLLFCFPWFCHFLLSHEKDIKGNAVSWSGAL